MNPEIKAHLIAALADAKAKDAALWIELDRAEAKAKPFEMEVRRIEKLWAAEHQRQVGLEAALKHEEAA